MIKKALKINILLIFLFVFCSSCSKSIEKCEIFEKKVESAVELAKNLKNNSISAQITCNY